MEKMEVRVVRGADTYTCTCNSCIMGFTVYGICTARGLYVLYFRGWSLRKYIQHEGGTIPCTVKTMRQLTCTDRPYKANHQAPKRLYSTLKANSRVYSVKNTVR